jgi:predicted metalloendopeptidase
MMHFLKTRFQIDIPQTEKIMVGAPEFFKKIGRIVKNARHDTLACYIVWSVVRNMVSFSGSAYEKIVNSIDAELTGVSSSPVLWQKCTSESNEIFGFVTGALYVEKYFSEADKKNIENIVAMFKEELAAQMSVMSWMDEETRKRASDKALAIEYKVGYPDFIINPQLLDQYYQTLTVTNSAFKNIMNLKTFAIELSNKKYGKAPDRSEWQRMPTEVNAYYSPQVNQIFMLAGILQQPFYHHSYPMSVNFGAIGYIIGHEFLHGFDNTGRQFDKFGNMVEWWGNASAQEYVKRSKCFQDEYSKFEVNGHRLNGLLTLGENIADNGGLKLSYAAYNRWASKNTDETRDQLLPGLNMTRSQQFFLAAAQVWCGSATEQAVVQSIQTDEHSPGRYRVIGAFRNTLEFAEAFSCSKTAALNPPEKCSMF